jgi:hypothetical protein
MRELRDKVARHYGRQVVQFSLSLPNPEAPSTAPSKSTNSREANRPPVRTENLNPTIVVMKDAQNGA